LIDFKGMSWVGIGIKNKESGPDGKKVRKK
jgi:hypothetical protein